MLNVVIPISAHLYLRTNLLHAELKSGIIANLIDALKIINASFISFWITMTNIIDTKFEWKPEIQYILLEEKSHHALF